MSKERFVFLGVGEHDPRTNATEGWHYSSLRGILVGDDDDSLTWFDYVNDCWWEVDVPSKYQLDHFTINDGACTGMTLEQAVAWGEAELAASTATNPFEASTDKALGAIAAMKAADPEYWTKVLASRLRNGTGSTTNFNSAGELEQALELAEWEPYEHPNVSNGYVAFMCRSIGGTVGIAPITSIDWYKLDDPKGTGKVSATRVFRDTMSDTVSTDFTVLVCGEEGGEEGEGGDGGELRAFTFHPGEPVRQSQIPAESYLGKTLQGWQLLDMGLTHAKVK
jgi:hypothetical protein